MDEMEWRGSVPLAGEAIEIGNASAMVEPDRNALMVSGDLAAALAALCPDARMVGLGEECGEQDFALRIARDRALLVTGQALDVEPGWYPAGYAVSSADDAFAAVALSGADAPAIIGEGVTADLKAASPSAAILFAGQFALLARRGEDYRLWIERPMLAWLWAWLGGAAISSGQR
ncbi:MAG TPA: hypothetical protein VK090_00335 [Paracoccaceae bacterium]|nr:hypothetical protein [Paracoccaceae bacterium]